MKNAKKIMLLCLMGGLLALLPTSCKTGEGCEMTNSYNTNKDGDLSSKRGKSTLFSKKQRKKMKR